MQPSWDPHLMPFPPWDPHSTPYPRVPTQAFHAHMSGTGYPYPRLQHMPGYPASYHPWTCHTFAGNRVSPSPCNDAYAQFNQIRRGGPSAQTGYGCSYGQAQGSVLGTELLEPNVSNFVHNETNRHDQSLVKQEFLDHDRVSDCVNKRQNQGTVVERELPESNAVSNVVHNETTRHDQSLVKQEVLDHDRVSDYVNKRQNQATVVERELPESNVSSNFVCNKSTRPYDQSLVKHEVSEHDKVNDCVGKGVDEHGGQCNQTSGTCTVKPEVLEQNSVNDCIGKEIYGQCNQTVSTVKPEILEHNLTNDCVDREESCGQSKETVTKKEFPEPNGVSVEIYGQPKQILTKIDAYGPNEIDDVEKEGEQHQETLPVAKSDVLVSVEEVSSEHFNVETSQRPHVFHHVCVECGQVFDHKRELSEHEKTHAGDGPVSSDDANSAGVAAGSDTEGKQEHVQVFDCKDCPAKFNAWGVFLEHRKWHRSLKLAQKRDKLDKKRDELDKKRDRLDKNYDKVDEEKKEVHNCTYCKKIFRNRHQKAMHERIHTGEKPFQCHFCDETFSRKDKMMMHVRRIHTGERPFWCKVCGKTYQTSSDLCKHKRIHLDSELKKRYKCTYCDKAYGTTSQLRNHENVHLGIKPFICQYCGKAFAMKPQVVSHERIHTGVKPWACRFCDKEFNSPGHRNKHERIHTGDKPHKCQYCGCAFNCPYNLRRHVKDHEQPNESERPYKCQKCGLGFAKKGNLKFHETKRCQAKDQLSL